MCHSRNLLFFARVALSVALLTGPAAATAATNLIQIIQDRRI
jgi:hypothetical protein